MTEIAFAFAALAAAGWILLAEIRTGSERLALAHLASWGPDDWDRAWRRCGHARHLLARITCRDWRRLYPARLVAALDLHDFDPIEAVACAARARVAVERERAEAWDAAGRARQEASE